MRDAKSFVKEVIVEPLVHAGLVNVDLGCEIYGSVPDDFESEVLSMMLVVEDSQEKGSGLPVFVTSDVRTFRSCLRWCCSMFPPGWRKRLSFARAVMDDNGLLLVLLSLDCDGFIADSVAVHDGR